MTPTFDGCGSSSSGSSAGAFSGGFAFSRSPAAVAKQRQLAGLILAERCGRSQPSSRPSAMYLAANAVGNCPRCAKIRSASQPQPSNGRRWRGTRRCDSLPAGAPSRTSARSARCCSGSRCCRSHCLCNGAAASAAAALRRSPHTTAQSITLSMLVSSRIAGSSV